MNPQKTMATAPLASGSMAKRNDSRLQTYNQPDSLSSTINELLAGLLVGLHYPHLSPPERATVLDTIDRLLRLKIDLKKSKGVRYERD